MLKTVPTRRRRPAPDNLFAWTIFIILLALVAVLSWMGSFYVFGHPEKGLSYSLLHKFGKIDPPERFKLTSAPRGKFLTAGELFAHFNPMSKSALQDESDLLLRNYIRNYKQTREYVPYVIGDYRVMGVFRLDHDNFFETGVVALAESVENPAVLLELVFPSTPENTQSLERMLQTGLELNLVKTLDLTAIIGARKLPDGRLSLTAVSLLYGNYTSSSASGVISLEPPELLNVRAGLPILNQAAVDAADENFRSYAERTGIVRKEMPAVLMRVQQTETARPTETPADDIPVARAIPVHELHDDAPQAPAAPVIEENIPIARAIPVTGEEPAATPPPTTPAPPAPSPSPSPAATVKTPARTWTLHQPGRMPRGRLVDLGTARSMAGQSISEKTYLRGNFNVSAAGAGRAVLRGQRGSRDIRVIAEFPGDAAVPPEGQSFSRDAQRPFEVTRVEQGADGQINVYVREVTLP